MATRHLFALAKSTAKGTFFTWRTQFIQFLNALGSPKKDVGGTFRFTHFCFKNKDKGPSCQLCHRLMRLTASEAPNDQKKIMVTFLVSHNRIFKSAIECTCIIRVVRKQLCKGPEALT